MPGIVRYETGISDNDLVAVMTQKGEVVALMNAEMSSGKIQAEDHGIVATTVRVVMHTGVYPKSW